MEQTIFYSWQSDLPNSCNRGFIQDCLESAIKDLRGDPFFKNSIVIDRDTSGVAGSPDIGQTILSKINKSIVFLCDVSIVSDPSAKRQTPNPNVLIELGYALNKLGEGKIIMVMNSAFGGPELLPFDLKQKRVMTYDLPEGENKTETRKKLKSSLVNAIKAVLIEHEKLNIPVAQIVSVSPADDLIQAITTNRADKPRAIHTFMKWLKEELKKLDPSKLQGVQDDLLVEAIKQTVPLVKEFDRVADKIAAMNDIEAARALIKDFEHLLSLCYLQQGFAGSYSNTDFELFKFVSQEMFIILIGYFLKDEYYSSINTLLRTSIHNPNSPIGPVTTNFTALSFYSVLLDEVRRNRLIVNNQKRISIHADMLKERHETGTLAENLSWVEFKNADLFLYFYAFASDGTDSFHWWPRTLVYQGWSSPIPRFLIDATTNSGAQTLSDTFNIESREVFIETISKAIANLTRGMSQIDMFAEPFRGFDVKSIPTT